MKKVIKSKIKLGLPFMVTDLVYKFQMICLQGKKLIERKPNVEHTDGCSDMGKT